MGRLLKSYIFWTYPRGSFHYDIMVTLILAFIFVTPHYWNYGDKAKLGRPTENPVSVVTDGRGGMLFSLSQADVDTEPGMNPEQIRKALHTSLESIAGDSLIIDRYEAITDRPEGGYKVWTHHK